MTHGTAFATMRLKDRIKPGVRVLFGDINPGVRSALTGHHFAGFSNRYLNLLFQSGAVPQPQPAEDEPRVPQWGNGIANFVSRPRPGIDTLRPDEYLAAVDVLRRKVK